MSVATRFPSAIARSIAHRTGVAVALMLTLGACGYKGPLYMPPPPPAPDASLTTPPAGPGNASLSPPSPAPAAATPPLGN